MAAGTLDGWNCLENTTLARRNSLDDLEAWRFEPKLNFFQEKGHFFSIKQKPKWFKLRVYFLQVNPERPTNISKPQTFLRPRVRRGSENNLARSITRNISKMWPVHRHTCVHIFVFVLSFLHTISIHNVQSHLFSVHWTRARAFHAKHVHTAPPLFIRRATGVIRIHHISYTYILCTTTVTGMTRPCFMRSSDYMELPSSHAELNESQHFSSRHPPDYTRQLHRP